MFKYIKIKSVFDKNKFFEHCKNNDIPYILIDNKVKWSTITVDLITLNKEMNNIESKTDELKRRFKDLIDAAIKNGDTKPKTPIKYDTKIIMTIKVTKDEYYAEKIFQIYKKVFNLSYE